MKQITVLMPTVPVELTDTIKIFPPPFLKDMTSSNPTGGVQDLELTFSYPPDVNTPEAQKEFEKVRRCNMVMMLIMYYETMPAHLVRVILHLVRTEETWKKRAIEAREKHPDRPDTHLMKWFIHELVIKGGDLLGVDHRPCWEAGTCLHVREG